MHSKNQKSPCNDCAFRRNSEPGKLGGSIPEVYVGQLEGPFVIPCHKLYDRDDPNGRQGMFDYGQCAGAAIMRANLGIERRNPDEIQRLPASKDVFGSYEEFYAHHHQISFEAAAQMLSVYTPTRLLQWQLRQPTAVTKEVSRWKDQDTPGPGKTPPLDT